MRLKITSYCLEHFFRCCRASLFSSLSLALFSRSLSLSLSRCPKHSLSCDSPGSCEGCLVVIVNGLAIVLVNGLAIVLVNGLAIVLVNGLVIVLVNQRTSYGVLRQKAEKSMAIREEQH